MEDSPVFFKMLKILASLFTGGDYNCGLTTALSFGCGGCTYVAGCLALSRYSPKVYMLTAGLSQDHRTPEMAKVRYQQGQLL